MRFDPLCWQAKIVPTGSSAGYRKGQKTVFEKSKFVEIFLWYPKCNIDWGKAENNWFPIYCTCYYFEFNFISPVLDLQDSSEGKLRSLSLNLANVGRSKSHGESACSMADLHKSKPTKVNCKPRQDFSFQPSYASPSNESECVLFTNLFGLECKGKI